MKKTLTKLVILLSPFVAIFVLELCAVPIDYFTPRIWTALTVEYFRDRIPGHFYPNYSVKKWEPSCKPGNESYRKYVEFYTDQYGYRNRHVLNDLERYDVVLVGDSHIGGSHLNQNEILSEVLERKSGLKVYNHAHRGYLDLQKFFASERFNRTPPQILVFELRRCDLYLPDLRLPVYAPPNKKQNWLPVWLWVLLDRAHKASALNWVRSEFGVRRPLARPRQAIVPPALLGPNVINLYYGTQQTNAHSATSVLDRKTQVHSHKIMVDSAVKAVSSYAAEAERRGMRFVVLYLPDVDVPSNRSNTVWPNQFVLELQRRNIEIVGFMGNPRHPAHIDHDMFWQKHDPHWSPAAVEYTSEKLLEAFAKPALRTKQITMLTPQMVRTAILVTDSPHQNEVVLKTEVTGFDRPVRYRFQAKKLGSKQSVMIQNYSSAGTARWVPESNGTWEVYMDVAELGCLYQYACRTTKRVRLGEMSLSARKDDP